MASISNQPGGRRTVQFVHPNGKRRSIRLGKMSARDADLFKNNVEALVSSIRSGLSPAGHVADWLRHLRVNDATMIDRLVKVGLLSAEAVVGGNQSQLGDFLDGYVKLRADVKSSTRVNLEHATGFLKQFFGETKLLRSITAGDADEFRLWLHTKVGDNTARRQCGRAKQFFRAAHRKRLIEQNPFGDMKGTSVRANKSREYFITVEAAQAVLDACPNIQWRLLFALARFGGLRTPSESLGLKWSDIDWERNQIRITSPKTEHHEGKDERRIPLFPELVPLLLKASEDAPPGSEYVITICRDASKNLRTTMERIVKRAGLPVWPKLFQNLRATRETELAQSYPIHVVCSWMGNSQLVAAKHYLQVRPEDFSGAALKPSALQIAVQNTPNTTEQDRTNPEGTQADGLEFCGIQPHSEQFGVINSEKAPPRGIEHDHLNALSVNDLGDSASERAADSGAVGEKHASIDAQLGEVIASWPALSEATRSRLLSIVRGEQ